MSASTAGPAGEDGELLVRPDEVIAQAKELGAQVLALAYTEPLDFFWYSLDLAQAARRVGRKVFMGTGGLCCPEPVAELAPHVDAWPSGTKEPRRVLQRHRRTRGEAPPYPDQPRNLLGGRSPTR